MDFFKSKKIKVFLVALILNAINVALAHGIITPELAEMLFYAINALAGSYIIGQGLADGMSHGLTSSSVPKPKPLDISELISFVEKTKAIEEAEKEDKEND